MPPAKLQGDGSAIARVAVACDGGLQMLEAHLLLSQDDQSVWGMAGLGRLLCDGRSHIHSVQVRPFEGAFHRGAARASAYVLRHDPATGATETANASRAVRIR